MTEAEYYKAWYQKNKDKHLTYCKTKILCECGKVIARCNLSHHKKTNVHQKRVNKIGPEKKMPITVLEDVEKLKMEIIDLKNKLKDAEKNII